MVKKNLHIIFNVTIHVPITDLLISTSDLNYQAGACVWPPQQHTNTSMGGGRSAAPLINSVPAVPGQVGVGRWAPPGPALCNHQSNSVIIIWVKTSSLATKMELKQWW